jgi:O-6-methylguanine DNA methyltransferase
MKKVEVIVYSSIVGLIRVLCQGEKVIKIEFIKDKDNQEEIVEIEEKIYGEKIRFSDMVFLQIEEYLFGKRKKFTFSYELKSTSFQKNVWNALLEIPYGETRTYKEIAVQIGNPKAYRAVGMANNRNPMPIIVPCHRVIGSNGKLVGYEGGIKIKEILLKIEAKNKEKEIKS